MSRIHFRCDASIQIGSGHVMRCLTLANALQQAGHDCHFILRDLPGHLAGKIQQLGFTTSLLPAPSGDFTPPEDSLAHAAWLGVSWQQDAQECRELWAEVGTPDWLVVDHYALDAQWQAEAIPAGCKLLVIDDLADRHHQCDLLLDQNLGRSDTDYASLIPSDAINLTGPHYALLRPEFAAKRATSLARRENAPLEHILISMGGMDKDNVTGQLLEALAEPLSTKAIRVTAVLGETAPARAAVETMLPTLPYEASLLVNVTDMAQLMVEADLAIGAAGSTSWERCCLGLPTLMMVLADNQAPAAQAMHQQGIAQLLGHFQDKDWPQRLQSALEDLSSLETRKKMTHQATALVDGQGVTQVMEHMKL